LPNRCRAITGLKAGVNDNLGSATARPAGTLRHDSFQQRPHSRAHSVNEKSAEESGLYSIACEALIVSVL
jgi:hypothetical protein